MPPWTVLSSTHFDGFLWPCGVLGFVRVLEAQARLIRVRSILGSGSVGVHQVFHVLAGVGNFGAGKHRLVGHVGPARSGGGHGRIGVHGVLGGFVVGAGVHGRVVLRGRVRVRHGDGGNGDEQTSNGDQQHCKMT